MTKIIIRRIILLILSTMLIYGIMYFLNLEERLCWENLWYAKIGANSSSGISYHLAILLLFDIAIIAAVWGVVYLIRRLRNHLQRQLPPLRFTPTSRLVGDPVYREGDHRNDGGGITTDGIIEGALQKSVTARSNDGNLTQHIFEICRKAMKGAQSTSEPVWLEQRS